MSKELQQNTAALAQGSSAACAGSNGRVWRAIKLSVSCMVRRTFPPVQCLSMQPAHGAAANLAETYISVGKNENQQLHTVRLVRHAKRTHTRKSRLSQTIPESEKT